MQDPVPVCMMTRSATERLEKLEEDYSEIKKSLEEMTAARMVLSKVIEQRPGGGAIPGGPQVSDQTAIPTLAATAVQLPATAVQLPPFRGANPIGWLARANQQFEIHSTAAEKKVSMAVVAMEESALNWVTWLRARKPELTWEEFSKALVARFDTRFKGSSFERLADLKQTGSVDDYVNLFVQLSSQVPGLTD